MPVLETPHKRKSAIITIVLLMLLLFGIFNYGMQYLDPPEEYGLAINFGNAEVGSGTPVLESSQKANPKPIEEPNNTEAILEASKKDPTEEVITNDTSETLPVVSNVKEATKDPVEEVVEDTKPVAVPKPKPSQEAVDALANLLNGNSSDGKPKGEGDDSVEGVKGQENGNSDSNTYYGNTQSGTGGDYNLAGRKALSKPKEQPNCEEEGIVVVQITVNNKGEVLSAIPGVKGSTNTALCLLKPAKEAALKTKWNSDSKAPSLQTGTIIYKFSLTK